MRHPGSRAAGQRAGSAVGAQPGRASLLGRALRGCLCFPLRALSRAARAAWHALATFTLTDAPSAPHACGESTLQWCKHLPCALASSTVPAVWALRTALPY